MRILHVYKDYYPVLGGIENYVRALAEAQTAAGHEVTVSVCAPGVRGDVMERKGVRIVRSGRLMTVASMPLSLTQPMFIARERAEIIHVHSPYPLGEASTWLFQRRAPLVITHHSDVVRQRRLLTLYAPILRRVLRRANAIIATSPRYVESSPWLRPVREKCSIVPLWVDTRRFSPPKHPFDGPPTLLFVGRLRYYKGLDTLLRALIHLPKVELRVVGTGPMAATWQQLAEALEIADRVHFLGEVEDALLPSLYHRAHLFVLPSNARSEAFGLVLLEAMASGLPCVSTELGTGTSWVVQDGITGRVVPPRDPQAMASAIAQLLANRTRLIEMGRAARARVEAHFTLERMVAGVEAVYRRALTSNGAPSAGIRQGEI